MLSAGFKPGHCALDRSHRFRYGFLGEAGLGASRKHLADKVIFISQSLIFFAEALPLPRLCEECLVII